MSSTLQTPQGFGFVVRALKKWRVMKSPIFDLAFERSSLTSLPAVQVETLRGNAQDLVRKSCPKQPTHKTRRRKMAQWKKMAWRRNKLVKLQRYTAIAKRTHRVQWQAWDRIAKENPQLWLWANFRKNGGFYRDPYANAVLSEYTQLQNQDPFIEDAFLRSFHKFCPTCGKSIRGRGRGYCLTPACREILEVNRKRRKDLRKWLMKRVEGDISMGPPFNDELCAWASREGYFAKFDTKAEQPAKEPAAAVAEEPVEEPLTKEPAATTTQELAQKTPTQGPSTAVEPAIKAPAEPATATVAKERAIQEKSMDTEPAVAPEPAEKHKIQEVSVDVEEAIEESAETPQSSASLAEVPAALAEAPADDADGL